MAITPTYTDPNAAPEHEHAILPIDNHYVRLFSLDVVPASESQYNKEQLKWSFIGLDYVDEYNRAGISSVWTGTEYGNPKAKLTQLIDSFFGRPLAREEAQRIDFERLVDIIEGWIQVVNAGDRQRPRSAFGMFAHPEGATLPNPADFFLLQQAPRQQQFPGRPGGMPARPGHNAAMTGQSAPQARHSEAVASYQQQAAPAPQRQAAPQAQQMAPAAPAPAQRPTNGTYTQANASRQIAGPPQRQQVAAGPNNYNNTQDSSWDDDPFDENQR